MRNKPQKKKKSNINQRFDWNTSLTFPKCQNKIQAKRSPPVAGFKPQTATIIPAELTETWRLPHQCSSQVMAWSAESPLCMRSDHPSPAVTELTTESHLDPGGRHRRPSGSLLDEPVDSETPTSAPTYCSPQSHRPGLHPCPSGADWLWLPGSKVRPPLWSRSSESSFSLSVFRGSCWEEAILNTLTISCFFMSLSFPSPVSPCEKK